MDTQTAEAIVGSLSSPSKMPCHTMSLPATACKTGSKLARIPGSVCSGCYAMHGRYRFGNVKRALSRRLDGIAHPKWVEAMVTLINSKETSGYFRWFDSGDFQSLKHIDKVMEVCRRTPHVKHWIATHEAKMYKRWLANGGVKPRNVVVRISADMVNERPPAEAPGSMVYTPDRIPKGAWLCPAWNQNNTCGDCRKCWSETKVVAYPIKIEGVKHSA